MTDQDLSEVSNDVFVSRDIDFQWTDGEGDGSVMAGYVAKWLASTGQFTIAQSNAAPASADIPTHIILAESDIDLDTAHGATAACRGIELGSGHEVWLKLSGAEAESTNGVAEGDQIYLSIQDAGMVRKMAAYDVTIINTPTSAVVGAQLTLTELARITRIGTCTETHAGHATEDRWIKVRLD